MVWYQALTLVISFLTLLGFGTVMKLYWEDKHKKKKDESQEAKERQKAERKQEIIEAVTEIFNPCSERIVKSIANVERRLDQSEKCDRAGLRNALMNIYYACNAKGYRTEDDSKNYREMHEAYREIGGNSFIDTDISRWFGDLPLKPNDYQVKNKGAGTKKQTNKRGGGNDE